MANRPRTARGRLTRADFGAPVETYLAQVPADQAALVRALHTLVMETLPNARAEIKWGMPVYSVEKLVCYVTAKQGYVRLGFYQRAAFDDPEGRLAGSMPHVKLRSVDEIDRVRFAGWIRTAREG